MTGVQTCALPILKEISEFLGAAGFCQVWILGFSEIAKPLLKATAGSDMDPLKWGPEQEKAFRRIKIVLTSAPGLGLPDVTQGFNLFVHEKITLHWGGGVGPHTNSWAMAAPSHIPVQTTGSRGCRMADMPLGISCHCGFGQRSR